jgi:demethylmenaquinone methyltransferase/2-methoxy-6-polyprenyl-1,4-benzoquinol methylase
LPEGLILDLGGGTGVATPLFGPRRQVVALDPVWEMLAVNPGALRVVGKGESLPFAGDTFDGIFSAFVFRNLQSVEATLLEGARVLRPGGVMVVVDAGRPIGRLARPAHRLGTSVFSPLVGVLAGAVQEYWYFHRSMDKLPHPETLFAQGPLDVEVLWRMGFLGGVYGVVLRKPPL